jgi:hypothetical protein
MLDVNSQGKVTERRNQLATQNWLAATLLGHIYPGIKVALVSIPAGEALEIDEQEVVKDKLRNIKHKGVEYQMVGASGSAKNGKYYYASKEYAPDLANRYQKWPEAAITYFGILTSNCRVIIEVDNARVLVVPDNQLGTNDCRGWIADSTFRKLNLPKGAFYQFRLAFDDKQAKGSFKVMDDDVAAFIGADIIIPESSIKPTTTYSPWNMNALGDRLTSGKIVLGIREVSRNLTFGSSYTVVQFATREVIEQEVVPLAIKTIEELRDAWNGANHRKLVEMVGKITQPVIEEMDGIYNEDARLFAPDPMLEYQRPIEAMLLADGSGEIASHPYINKKLKKLMAKWAHRLLTGGGLQLPAFALADDGYLVLDNGNLYTGSDWLPMHLAITSLESKRSLCVRYPVRMREDLLPMTNCNSEMTVDLLVGQGLSLELAERITKEQLMLTATYTLHSQQAKKNGGDFDFDQICVVDEALYPMFVESRFSFSSAFTITKAKRKRARSPMFNMVDVAWNTLGNKIGQITNLMSSAIAAGLDRLIYELVEQLQLEIDSLKHGVRSDDKVLREIREKIGYTAPWLTLKDCETIDDLPLYLDVLPADKVGWMYNTLRSVLEDVVGTPLQIHQFSGLITGHPPTSEMLLECKMVHQTYGSGCAMLIGNLESQKLLVKSLTEQVIALKGSGDRKSELKAVRKQLRKQKAVVKYAEDHLKEQMSNLQAIFGLWAAGKEVSTRRQWCQALNTVVSKGHGIGSLLFHTFPQEFVDMTAERTGGIRTTVPPIAQQMLQDGVPVSHMIVKGNRFYCVSKVDGSLIPTFYLDESDPKNHKVRAFTEPMQVQTISSDVPPVSGTTFDIAA